MVREALLSLIQMESLAREATRAALMKYRQPDNAKNLVFGSEITNEEGIFELYIAGDQPADAQVISRVSINRKNSNIEIEVFPDNFWQMSYCDI